MKLKLAHKLYRKLLIWDSKPMVVCKAMDNSFVGEFLRCLKEPESVWLTPFPLHEIQIN